jgi:F0F1-type ATP synthase assembly protein I
MIKNLLNADEEPPEGTKVIIEETIESAPPEASSVEPSAVEKTPPAEQTRPAFEIPDNAKFFASPAEAAPLDEDSESLAALAADIENLDDNELDLLEKQLAAAQGAAPATPPANESSAALPPIEAEETPLSAQNADEKADDMPLSGTIFQTEYTPPSTGETIRNSGLAWSAGIVLFGSVVFMMIFGWFADLLLGSSPWGLVGGIVLGGLIGIFQLFRISSQIHNK